MIGLDDAQDRDGRRVAASPLQETDGGRQRINNAQVRARVWTLCLAALVLAALTGPLADLLTPLAHASSLALHVVATVLAAALVGGYVALAVLLIGAVLHVVRPHLDGHR